MRQQRELMRLAVVVLIGGMLMVACGGGQSALPTPGDTDSVVQSKVLPPGSKAYGKSLTEWMGAYWSWFFGASDEGGEKNVVFLPLPAGELVSEDPWTFEGELDVDLAAGDAFFLPMLVWVGETYDPDLGIPDDDPDVDGLTADEVFEDATVEIVLDGKTIIDSEVDDMADFLVYAEFDETIWYDEATEYGSIGALWAKGLGFVHTPLSPGEHTLELYVYSEDWYLAFDNTWYITVQD